MSNGLGATVGALIILPLTNLGISPPNMFLVLVALEVGVIGIMVYRYRMFARREEPAAA